MGWFGLGRSLAPNIRIEPFPHGFIDNFLPDGRFDDLRASFPEAADFDPRPDLGNKMLMNEHRNGATMRAFLERSPSWRSLYQEAKGEAAAKLLLRVLTDEGVDLGVSHLPVDAAGVFEGAVASPDEASVSGPARVETRIEFFRQPMPGGSHFPHTDRPGKLATFLIGMNAEDWPAPGIGALSICRARDPRSAYNVVNRYLTFDEVEVVEELPHRPNRANVLVKTHNSLHAVFPSNANAAPLPDRLTFVIQLYVFPMPVGQRRA